MEATFTILQDGTIGNPKSVRKFFESHEPGTWVLVSKAKNVRSLQANAYIHAVLFPEALIALKEGGFSEIRTVDDAKAVCKGLFAKVTYTNHSGATLEKIQDTHEMSKLEMSEFIENTIRWLSEYFNHVVPPPSTQTMMEFQ